MSQTLPIGSSPEQIGNEARVQLLTFQYCADSIATTGHSGVRLELEASDGAVAFFGHVCERLSRSYGMRQYRFWVHPCKLDYLKFLNPDSI